MLKLCFSRLVYLISFVVNHTRTRPHDFFVFLFFGLFIYYLSLSRSIGVLPFHMHFLLAQVLLSLLCILKAKKSLLVFVVCLFYHFGLCRFNLVNFNLLVLLQSNSKTISHFYHIKITSVISSISTAPYQPSQEAPSTPKSVFSAQVLSRQETGSTYPGKDQDKISPPSCLRAMTSPLKPGWRQHTKSNFFTV